MKLQDIWNRSDILISIVPLAIDDYGFIYLNDIGIWNVTINEKHRHMHNHQITIQQLQHLVLSSRCDISQQTNFKQAQNQLLKSISSYQDDFILTF